VSHDVASDWLFRIRIEGHAVDLRHHLIGDNDCNTKLVGQPLESTQKQSKILLTIRQLPPARNVMAFQNMQVYNVKLTTKHPIMTCQCSPSDRELWRCRQQQEHIAHLPSCLQPACTVSCQVEV
jgi:hypothetical protein